MDMISTRSKTQDKKQLKSNTVARTRTASSSSSSLPPTPTSVSTSTSTPTSVSISTTIASSATTVLTTSSSPLMPNTINQLLCNEQNPITSPVSISYLADMEKRFLMNIGSLLDSKLDSIKQSLQATIRAEIAAINSKVNAMSDQITAVENRLSIVERSISSDHLYSNKQHQRIQRLSDVIITGIPYVACEKPIEVFKSVAACVNFPASPYTKAFRLKPKVTSKGSLHGSSPPIVVKMSCQAERDTFIFTLKTWKKKLTLSSLNCGFDSESVFNVYDSLL